jgi:soluble lytic murein transglycosylase-like protein
MDTSWPGVYNHRVQCAADAPTPERRAHFESEVKLIAITLDAMGIAVPAGPPANGHVAVDQAAPPVVLATAEAPAPLKPQKPLVADRAVQPAPGGSSALGLNAPPGLEPLRPYIQNASALSDVPANLIGSMVWQESRGVIHARSVNGGNGLTDVGLMQINPNTYSSVIVPLHPELGDIHDPGNNILAAAYYMDYLKEKYGSWELALRAYNSGEQGVDVNDVHATPAGTGDPTYVWKVMGFWSTLDSGQGQLPP